MFSIAKVGKIAGRAPQLHMRLTPAIGKMGKADLHDVTPRSKGIKCLEESSDSDGDSEDGLDVWEDCGSLREGGFTIIRGPSFSRKLILGDWSGKCQDFVFDLMAYFAETKIIVENWVK